VILVVTFFVVLLMTKPTQKELDLGKRLAGFDRGLAADQMIDPDILKREVYSDLPLGARDFAANQAFCIYRRAHQAANCNWTVGQMLLALSWLSSWLER